MDLKQIDNERRFLIERITRHEKIVRQDRERLDHLNRLAAEMEDEPPVPRHRR